MWSPDSSKIAYEDFGRDNYLPSDESRIAVHDIALPELPWETDSFPSWQRVSVP
jgi:hypothetical protein